jgi:ribosome-binding protein aMBF1 (putative translation factor)
MRVNDLRMKFSGAKLRAAREEAGWSREELAVSSGRAAETIAKYERDFLQIPEVVARTFAALLKVDVGSLAEDAPKRRAQR